MGNPKCKDCLSCLDLVYFGPKRFWHCWLCDVWYDGILPNLFVVDKKTIDEYIQQYQVKPDELNSDK